MNKRWLLMAALLAATVPAAALDLEEMEGKSPECLFDNNCGSAAAPPVMVVEPSALAETAAAGPAVAPRIEAQAPLPERAWLGAKKGAGEGAKLGFFGVLSPAVSLISESFGRQMSSYYDGPRSDNGGGRAMWWGGLALAVLLYVPALVAGAAGGIAGSLVGAGAESVKPGSTEHWNVEKAIFD